MRTSRRIAAFWHRVGQSLLIHACTIEFYTDYSPFNSNRLPVCATFKQIFKMAQMLNIFIIIYLLTFTLLISIQKAKFFVNRALFSKDSMSRQPSSSPIHHHYFGLFYLSSHAIILYYSVCLFCHSLIFCLIHCVAP